MSQMYNELLAYLKDNSVHFMRNIIISYMNDDEMKKSKDSHRMKNFVDSHYEEIQKSLSVLYI